MPHLLFPVAPAQRDIVVLADRYLFALARDLAVGAEPHRHRYLAAAAADDAHLAQVLGNGKNSEQARKQIALEGCAQALAHDGNVESVGAARQLLSLFFSKKCASSTKKQ